MVSLVSEALGDLFVIGRWAPMFECLNRSLCSLLVQLALCGSSKRCLESRSLCVRIRLALSMLLLAVAVA